MLRTLFDLPRYSIWNKDLLLNVNPYKTLMKNSCPCWDLNPGPPRYQADMLPTELDIKECTYEKKTT